MNHGRALNARGADAVGGEARSMPNIVKGELDHHEVGGRQQLSL